MSSGYAHLDVKTIKLKEGIPVKSQDNNYL